MRHGLVCLITVVALAATATAWPPIEEIAQAIAPLELPAEAMILETFELGLAQGRLLPEDALRLIGRLDQAAGTPVERERVLLIIADALHDDLPVTMLVSKASEGLARRIRLPVIAQGLAQRMALLVEVRALLWAKGIIVSDEETSLPQALPQERFERLVNVIAEVLGDHLAGGGSPLDGFGLYEEVERRLNWLASSSVIPAEDAELALSRIGPEDLTNVAIKALD